MFLLLALALLSTLSKADGNGCKWINFPGYHLDEGYVPGYESACFPMEDAKVMCAETPGCKGINKQENQCGGNKYSLRDNQNTQQIDGWGADRMYSLLMDCDCATPVEDDMEAGVNYNCIGGCINDNIGYLTLGEAWRKCAEIDLCAHVLKYSNGKFYLRKNTDSRFGDGSTKALSFCDKPGVCHVPAPHTETTGGFNCNGQCIDGNVEHADLESAWKRCGEVPLCTRVMRFSEGRFFLRKADDPPSNDLTHDYHDYCDKTASPTKTPTSQAPVTSAPVTPVPTTEAPTEGPCYQNYGKGPCEEICTEDSGTAVCSCTNGKALNSDGKTCNSPGHYVVMGRPGAICVEGEDCSTRVELDSDSFAIRCCEPSVQTTCEAPHKSKMANVALNCQGGNCINNNIGYNTLSAAWDKCPQVDECAIITELSGKYYLRRESDIPRRDGAGKQIKYECIGYGPFWRKRPECSTGVFGASKFDDNYTCLIGDYNTAFNACKDNGARLCTKEEVESGCVAYSGCQYDFRPVWTSTEGGYVADHHSNPPTTALPTTMRPTESSEPRKRIIVQRNKNVPCSDPDDYCDSRLALTEEIYAISCCADSDINQEWYQRNQDKHECHGVWTESDIWYMHHDIVREHRCMMGTWYDAERICKENGGRLCTRLELEKGCAEATGCNFDGLMNWSSDA